MFETYQNPGNASIIRELHISGSYGDLLEFPKSSEEGTMKYSQPMLHYAVLTLAIAIATPRREVGSKLKRQYFYLHTNSSDAVNYLKKIEIRILACTSLSNAG